MQPTIRFATPDDAPGVHAFIQALADYEKEPDAVEVTPAALEEQMRRDPPPFECLIASWDGADAGFALFFHNYSTWRGRQGVYLEDLFVRPESRGNGVGKALLEAVARIAVERGCARMEWAVLDWNEPAMGFYRALGARQLDAWRIYRLTDDALAAVGAPRA